LLFKEELEFRLMIDIGLKSGLWDFSSLSTSLLKSNIYIAELG
jgi:hypothetical protein